MSSLDGDTDHDTGRFESSARSQQVQNLLPASLLDIKYALLVFALYFEDWII